MRAVLRWLLRITAVVLGLVVLGMVVIAIGSHTERGREMIRSQLESRLAETFTGGATVGQFEGSVFGNMVVRDVVINGPDRKPAITIDRVELQIPLLPLASHTAVMNTLKIDGVTVLLERDANGELEIGNLLAPGPKSTWNVELRHVEIANARVAFDTGDGVEHIDDIAITGSLRVLAGKAVTAKDLVASGRWREKDTPFVVAGRFESGDRGISLPAVFAQVGAASIAGSDISIGNAHELDGLVVVNAPARQIAALVPQVQLPADVLVAIDAATVPRPMMVPVRTSPLTDAQRVWATIGSPFTEIEKPTTPVPVAPRIRIAVTGLAGRSPIHARVNADLDGKRAAGVIAASDVDLGTWTRGAVTGRGGAVVVVDAAAGASGELPTGHAIVDIDGAVNDLPHARAHAVVETEHQRATAVVDVSGSGVRAHVDGAIRRSGDALVLERSRVVAIARDLPHATAGKAPIRGALDVELAVHGPLRPAPDLAVAGHIDGRKLAVADLRAETLHAMIDAKRLPAHPLGTAHVAATDLVSGDLQLGELTIDAANRTDKRIDVAVRSKPKFPPWLIEADALVTPGTTTVVDLERHHVRANGRDWAGTTGRLEIGSRTIALRDLETASGDQSIAARASFDRIAGDLTAAVETTHFALESVAPNLHGKLDGKLAVQRRRKAWSGNAQVTATGFYVDTGSKVKPVTVDGKLALDAKPGKVTGTIAATATRIGNANIALDIDAPRDLVDVRAWKRLTRGAIRTADVTLKGIDLGAAAQLAELPGPISGKLDTDIQVRAATASGTIKVTELLAPSQHVTSAVSADVAIASKAADELTPTANVRITGIGGAKLAADVAIPDRVFDPAAWRKLGRDALRSATVRVDEIPVEPSLLERFGVAATMRGKLKAAVDIGPGARENQLAIDVRELRGGVIDRPIDVHLDATTDARRVHAQLGVRNGKQLLVTVTGDIAAGIDNLTKTAPLTAKLQLPAASAPALLAVLGRSDVTAGTVDGTIDVAGTLGAPTVVAKLGARDIHAIGISGKQIQVLTQLAIDASWDGTTGKVAMTAAESGGGSLSLVATGSPRDLAAATASVDASKLDVEPITAFAPGVVAGVTGRLDAKLRAKGLDPRTSQITGNLHMSEARLPIAPTVGTLRKADIQIGIDPHAMKINVDGRLGAGTVKITGTAVLDGAAIGGADLKAKLTKVSPIGAVEPVITADVTAKLKRNDSRWLADVTIDHGDVSVPSSTGQRLSEIGPPPDMRFAAPVRKKGGPPRVPDQPVLLADVTLNATNVTSDELRGIIRGKVTIIVSAQDVGLDGTIEADRGDLDLFGRRYQVERAAAHFDGTTDPILDVRVTHDFPDVTTITEVHDRLSKPTLVMTSSPATYSQGQLLGFLLGGEPGGDPSSGNTKDTATSTGASLVAGQIAGYVRKALPVNLDVLRYEAATATSSGAVTVGKWLSHALFVSYRQHLEVRPDENNGEVSLEYWLARRLVLEGVAGDRGVESADLLWRRRW